MKLNIVRPHAGFTWFRQGLATFWRQPFALTGLFLLFIGLIAIVSLVPVVGSVIALALLPAMTLSLMAATREVAQGKFPMPALLLLAFRTNRQRVKAMLLLGAMYAVGLLLVLGASALADGGHFARFYLFGGPLTEEIAADSTFRSALVVTMVLYIPFTMLFWHAPALVHWHDVPPLRSLFFSFIACARNFLAYAFYTLAWMVLSLIIAFALIFFTALVGNVMLTGALLLPFSLLMGAMFFTSIWFTFQGSFLAQEAESVVQ